MENKNKIILALLIILTISVVGFCVFRVLLKNEELTDAIKFYNEYSELNNKENKNNGKKYVRVEDQLMNHTFRYTLSNDEEYVCGEYAWVEVLPIKWWIDEKAKVMITEKIVFTDTSLLSKT